MRQPDLMKPLSDAEQDKLIDILNNFKNTTAMNLENVDGFFTALQCAPQTIPLSELLNEVWGGGEMLDEDAFESEQKSNLFFQLLLRHWNDVTDRLEADEAFFPLFLGEEGEEVKGNDWAAGFLQGTTYAYDDWMELFEDEDYRHALVAIFALANEHNPDPEVRPFNESINSEQREDLLVSMAVSVTVIHRYFEPYRNFNFGEIVSTGTIRRDHPKIGRNEPCPCGSGKKYKKCCAQMSVH